MFYLNSTLNFGIPPVLIFQLEFYYKVDRLLTAQPKGTTARCYSNKSSLLLNKQEQLLDCIQIKNLYLKYFLKSFSSEGRVSHVTANRIKVGTIIVGLFKGSSSI